MGNHRVVAHHGEDDTQGIRPILPDGTEQFNARAVRQAEIDEHQFEILPGKHLEATG